MKGCSHFSFFLSFSLFLLTACGSASIERAHQSEALLQSLRADLEEVRNDLGSHQMELNILEGKFVAQENSLIQLREESLQKAFVKLEKLQVLASQLERRSTQLEKVQEETLSEMRQMVNLAQDVQKISSFHKDRFHQIEDKIGEQQLLLNDLLRLKKDLLKELAQMDEPIQYYKVKSGDNLEKIARQFHTSVDQIKKINRLTGDQILAGDQILVPSTA